MSWTKNDDVTLKPEQSVHHAASMQQSAGGPNSFHGGIGADRAFEREGDGRSFSCTDHDSYHVKH